MRFDDDFFRAQQRRRQQWAGQGIKSGSGRPFEVGEAVTPEPVEKAAQEPPAATEGKGASKGAGKVAKGASVAQRRSEAALQRAARAKRPVVKSARSPHKVALAALAKNPGLLKGNKEHYEQVRVMAHFEDHDPELYELMAAIPNGGLRSRATAGKMKAEGQKSGYPDIVIDLPAGGYHGARIEMKAEGGRATTEQKARLNLLSQRGYFCALCDGHEDAIEVITRYRNLQPGEVMPVLPSESKWKEAA